MTTFNRRNLLAGTFAGVAVTAITAVLMGQGASTPAKSETQYFVTGEGDAAHLWVRDGAKLRCVGHGECTTHGDHGDHDHGDDHGHDHKEPTPKP